MTLEKSVRASLWITAPFNLIAAYAFIFPESVVGALIGVPASSNAFFVLLSASLVALFGFTYAWLALQPTISKPVLFLGAFGKLSAVTISYFLYFTGELPGAFAIVISGDLIFSTLWFYYIRSAS